MNDGTQHVVFRRFGGERAVAEAAEWLDGLIGKLLPGEVEELEAPPGGEIRKIEVVKGQVIMERIDSFQVIPIDVDGCCVIAIVTVAPAPTGRYVG